MAIRSRVGSAFRRCLAVVLMLAAIVFPTGCGSIFHDQVPVDPDHRLVVGNSFGLFNHKAKAWVIENGEVHDVKVVRGDSK